ncbi:MAG TPA: ATP-binding protein [Tepidisphaeraceae bacterium]|nr:ATP-binding protein [Tepidisphaeraceae bacterium]
MRSIRTTLVIGLVTAVLVVAAFAGTVLLLVVRARVVDEFDEALSAKAHAMAGMVRRDDKEKGKVEVNFAEEMQREFAAGPRAEFFVVFDEAGQIIERSPSWKGATHELPFPSASKINKAFRVTLPDGRPGRMVATTFVPEVTDDDDEIKGAPQRHITLVLARGAEPITHTLELVGWGLACAAVIMAAGAAGAVWILVEKSLRPLNTLAGQAQQIDAGNLAMRFQSDVPKELQPIVGRLNELLQRLQSSFARERRFTSAAAHELRTPIAELRAMAEVAIRWPANPQQGMHDVLAVAQNMESLAASLLALSRCESGQEQAQRLPVDLAAIATRIRESIEKKSLLHNIHLHIETTHDTTVTADPAMTEAIIRNLFENALEYATPGSTVICRIGNSRLSVTNPQINLIHDDLPHLFDPFWRKDTSRTGGAHAGLGLSLVRSYAAAMDSKVELELTPDNCFRATVFFPLRRTSHCRHLI